MTVLQQILAETGIARPDGRPLYALPMSEERHAEIGRLLRSLSCVRVHNFTAQLFVLWAAERIRSGFVGGPLKWEFVFRGLGWPEHREFGVELVKIGLPLWGRKVQVSDGGMHLYLYSIMAEGGLPQALLVQPGLYQHVLKGLLANIEAEGADVPEALAYRIAGRWVMRLPQAFRTDDVTHLLADLALALARLRTEAPGDIPPEIIDRWLDRHRPHWVQELPLRLSKDVADALIRPALRADRKTPVSAGPLAWRALIRDEATGNYRAVMKIAEQGFLATTMLPEADGFRLRFIPTGIASDGAGSLVYSANPDDDGWILRRIGRAGTVTIPLAIDSPFVLSGFADGHMVGVVPIGPALPSPQEAPSLWRPAEADARAVAPAELLPLTGTGKTRASHVWLLTAEGDVPVPRDGVALSKPLAAAGGVLWPMSGAGEVWVGQHRWCIATAADEETADATLLARGDFLPGWRSAGNGGYVFRGHPELLGQHHTGSLRLLHRSDIRKRPARILMGEIAEWVAQDAVLARMSYVALPQAAQLDLRETGPGALELRVEGLPSGLSLKLTAGQTKAQLRLAGVSSRLALSVPGAVPGIVTLRLLSPETGAALDLVAPWPARNGMILAPDDSRIERNTPLSIDALPGWRAVFPPGGSTDIQFSLDGCPPVAVRAQGEIPLAAAYLPLIRSMLAHGGADAQVRVSLVTEGKESPRLEICLYEQQTNIHHGRLQLGLKRGEKAVEETAFEILGGGKAILHAVDLAAPERTQRLEIDMQGRSIDLRTLLPKGSALWFVQGNFRGKSQRPIVWSQNPLPHSSRADRIKKYAAEWKRLLDNPADASWDSRWRLIQAVDEVGDAGALDQVQAIEREPAAAVALVLRVPKDVLAQALELDAATAIFWPTVPVEAFVKALNQDHSRRLCHYSTVITDRREAEHEATTALARRIGDILLLHPEIAGHFGAALTDTGFLTRIIAIKECSELFVKVFISVPEKKLAEYAQQATRRFYRLPNGVQGIKPSTRRPPGLIFNPYAQPVIDAPLVAAEIAAGVRAAPDRTLTLALISLRLVDPVYFDTALPAALAFVRERNRP